MKFPGAVRPGERIVLRADRLGQVNQLLQFQVEAVVNEKVYADKADPNILHDEITTADHALTRPWTVTRSYKRQRNPAWAEYDCHENNEHIIVGSEAYVVSSDGYLMPTRKDQPPPDPRYFNKSGK